MEMGLGLFKTNMENRGPCEQGLPHTPKCAVTLIYRRKKLFWLANRDLWWPPKNTLDAGGGRSVWVQRNVLFILLYIVFSKVIESTIGRDKPSVDVFSFQSLSWHWKIGQVQHKSGEMGVYFLPSDGVMEIAHSCIAHYRKWLFPRNTECQ